MKPKVLLVDDDAAWLKTMQKELEKYSGAFSVISAYDGSQALEVMASDQVSLVVSDLRMPNIDGFELLNQVLHKYPDIPVIIITAYDRPKTREVVFKSGADDYMTKPFTAGELAEKITGVLKKKSEGGSLHNVSLETFLQLIEMEQQNCTLRIVDKDPSRTGVLFFRDGELMGARLGGRLGLEAAYEILSWSGVSVSIENRCPIKEKQLEGGLQAILLDAMRTKDESEEDFNSEEESETDEIMLDSPVKEGQSSNPGVEATGSDSAKSPAGPRPEPPGISQSAVNRPKDSSPAAVVSEKLNSALGDEEGVEDIYEDPEWHYLIERASRIGKNFEAGGLLAVYVNKGRKGHCVIVPGEPASVILMSPDTSRDRIIDAVI
ncbi:MAG: response regulator [Desulfobacteraceae bacterium]|nr:response regulator [Desulfobacteraceae bacterium]